MYVGVIYDIPQTITFKFTIFEKYGIPDGSERVKRFKMKL